MTPSKCTCVSCGECKGSGQVEIRTGSYPEWDLDTCSECDGSGVSQMCADCEEAEEFEEDYP